MPPIGEILVAATLVAGTFLTFVACFGLLRFPDVFSRMHASGKAGTLGVSLTVAAVMLFFLGTDWTVALRGTLAIFFQFLTTPAATHLLARAAYVADLPLTERTEVDELKAHIPGRPHDVFGQE